MKKKILITGGDGRFASTLKKYFFGKNIYFLNKNLFNVCKPKQMIKVIDKIKPEIVIHLAALSRPTIIHEKNINLSIDINIIGTANLVKICCDKKIKLVHFSTHYLYPGINGNYKEQDPLLPFNNYGWSKLGAESSVQLYLKNSLIIRVAMSQTPYEYSKAYTNRKSNFLTHHEVAKILPKLLNRTGIINLGGVKRTIYNFARISNSKVKKQVFKNNNKNYYPKDTSVNISKLKKIIK